MVIKVIEDKEVREQVQKLVEEKYSDRMYQYYTGIADSVGNLTSNTWQYATDVQEVRRYLKGVTGEDISLENLYLTPDGKIGGLPEKAANLINKTKDNAKIERIKDALINIIGHNRTSGGSHARPGEDSLCDDRTGKGSGDLKSENGDQRRECVL